MSLGPEDPSAVPASATILMPENSFADAATMRTPRYQAIKRAEPGASRRPRLWMGRAS